MIISGMMGGSIIGVMGFDNGVLVGVDIDLDSIGREDIGLEVPGLEVIGFEGIRITGLLVGREVIGFEDTG